SSLMQTALVLSLVSVFELLYAGQRCNITTERYGGVYVLAVQGCASPELCGSNQTLSYKGFEYKITYTCCCRDLCNKAAAAENHLKQLFRVTKSPADNITVDPLS
ncbi:hypothetical protein M9458_036787, partial [Cirrhinus mrigala]